MKILSRGIRWIVVAASLLASCFLVPSPQAQPPKKETPALLTVRGIAAEAVALTAADLEKLPHQSLKVKDKGGETITYEGVLLSEALKRAGLDFEANLHGRGLTRYLLVEAADKYRIVFSLAEFDPAFTDRILLLATRRDGKPLSNEEGPCRLLIPDDKRQARWVRQVRVLTLLDAVAPSEHNKKP